MRNYYIFITVSFVVFVATIITAFTQIGSPMDIRGRNLDSTRVTDIQSIYYAIEGQIRNSNKLPQSLSDVTTITRYKDPETQIPYTYNAVSSNSFELCATFATEGKPKEVSSYPPSNAAQHKKGYDCIIFTINNFPTNSYQVTPTLAPQPTVSTEIQTVPSNQGIKPNDTPLQVTPPQIKPNVY